MLYPIWLKIWLGLLSIAVLLGFFPFIVMYFKVNKRPMWELPLWQENKVAKFLIPMPQGGYSRETWIAIRPQYYWEVAWGSIFEFAENGELRFK